VDSHSATVRLVTLLLLRTDRRGRVLAIAAGGGDLGRALAPGGTLVPLIADPGAAPLLDFLLALRRSGAAVAGEVPAAPAAGVAALSFAGVTAGAGCWIAAAGERGGLAAWCRGLLAGAAGDLDPPPDAEALERLAGLLAEAEGDRARPSTEEAGEVTRLQRLLAEKDREIAELQARLAQPEGALTR